MTSIHPVAPASHTVYLSIGSNMGDKVAHCHHALNAIRENGVGTILSKSPYYRTEPQDYLDQDWFINAAVKIASELDPLALLSALQAIEFREGRRSGGIRFGPRILDLDIIFFDDLIVQHERLQIPHPRMHKRRFVLQPICDIDPQVVHPVLGQSVITLLNQIADREQRIFRQL